MRADAPHLRYAALKPITTILFILASTNLAQAHGVWTCHALLAAATEKPHIISLSVRDEADLFWAIDAEAYAVFTAALPVETKTSKI